MPARSRSTDRPFAALSPDCLWNALDSVGLHGDGRLLALNSYENRVYQAGMDEGPPLVTKVYRPERWSDQAILEEHQFLFQLAEAELPVVPPLRIGGATLHHYQGFRFSVFPRQGGRVPELTDSARLEWVGRLIGRIHAVGATAPFRFRPALDPISFGQEPMAFLIEHGWIPNELIASYRSVADQALQRVFTLFGRAGSYRSLRLHGDCYPGNILWTDDGPHFVDFDDSRSGPAIQDLWMLLSGDRGERGGQLADLLAGYECFFDFDTREIQLIEALRTLRMLHYAAWLARRWNDPAFPQAFPWFNTAAYWQDHILSLREQVAAMDEPPLWSS
ncbi:MAG: serine/threonine protein kinase [Methylococcaceae bacterium]|nr:serine/threonine protein kinase [Methylococcaceae bacterium]